MLADNQLSDLRKGIEDLVRTRQTIKKRRCVSINGSVPDLLGTFPTTAVCDKILSAYLRTFEPIYRILHVPSFLSDYQNFCNDLQSSSTTFRIRLALVLAIGTTFYSSRTDGQHLQRSARTWVRILMGKTLPTDSNDPTCPCQPLHKHHYFLRKARLSHLVSLYCLTLGLRSVAECAVTVATASYKRELE